MPPEKLDWIDNQEKLSSEETLTKNLDENQKKTIASNMEGKAKEVTDKVENSQKDINQGSITEPNDWTWDIESPDSWTGELHSEKVKESPINTSESFNQWKELIQVTNELSQLEEKQLNLINSNKELVNEIIVWPDFNKITDFFNTFRASDKKNIAISLPKTEWLWYEAKAQLITKTFLSIPKDIIKTVLPTYNLDGKRSRNTINETGTDSLIAKVESYQNTVWQITKTELIIQGKNKMKLLYSKTTEALANYEGSQIIWELRELPQSEQIKVQENINNIEKKYNDNYKITWINLIWYADATRVTDFWKEKIELNFNKHIKLLEDAGLNTTSLPKNYDDLGLWLVENWKIDQWDMNNPDIVSNWGFAVTRAIMQISWMNPEQIAKIKDSKLNLDIRTSDVIGDEETRWWIEFNGTWVAIGETPPSQSTIKEESPEAFLESWFNVTVNIWGKIKVFKLQKDIGAKWGNQERVINSNNIVSVGHTWNYGNQKTTAEYIAREGRSFWHSDKDFSINIPNLSEFKDTDLWKKHASTIQKILNNDMSAWDDAELSKKNINTHNPKAPTWAEFLALCKDFYNNSGEESLNEKTLQTIRELETFFSFEE